MRLTIVYATIVSLLHLGHCHGGPSVREDLLHPTDSDKQSHYRFMMAKNTEDVEEEVEVETKKDDTIKISSQIEIPDSEGLRLAMEALKVIGKATWKGLFHGLFPTLERTRRDASHDWERNFLLDWLLDMLGAILGRQKCSQKVACRTGKVLQDKLPGAQMMVVMAEAMIPPAALHWFGIVRQSVIERRDSCRDEYLCDFSQD